MFVSSYVLGDGMLLIPVRDGLYTVPMILIRSIRYQAYFRHIETIFLINMAILYTIFRCPQAKILINLFSMLFHKSSIYFYGAKFIPFRWRSIIVLVGS